MSPPLESLGEGTASEVTPRDAACVFQLTRNGIALASRALDDGSALAVSLRLPEEQRIGFELQRREPDTEYRVCIGNAVPSLTEVMDSSAVARMGDAMGRQVFWRDDAYLESARGRTWIALESRELGADHWRARASLGVLVVPSKLEEERYERMFRDLFSIAAGLVFDLVSKSSAALALAGHRVNPLHADAGASANQLELRRLEIAWRELSQALAEIERTPVYALHRSRRPVNCWGGERLQESDYRSLATQAIDPRVRGHRRPFRLSVAVPEESFATLEHARIAGLMRLLADRARACAAGAFLQRNRLLSDRGVRDLAMGEGPSLFQSVDRPRLERLDEAERRAHALERAIQSVLQRPFLRASVPALGSLRSPVFDNVRPYRRFRAAAERFVRGALVLVDDGDAEQMKSTARMYEQWVFLQLVAAFRHMGLRSQSVDQLVRRTGWYRYTLDLERGSRVTLRGREGRTIAIRYEPWIFPRLEAEARRDSVYRGRSGSAPWSPDVLIELLSDDEGTGVAPGVEYAVIVDAKYSRTLRDTRWANVEHYLDVKSVKSGRQVVHQLWLAHPDASGEVRSHDSDCQWHADGPDLPRGDRWFGILPLMPDVSIPEFRSGDITPVTNAIEFARGLLCYFGFVEGTDWLEAER